MRVAHLTEAPMPPAAPQEGGIWADTNAMDTKVWTRQMWQSLAPTGLVQFGDRVRLKESQTDYWCIGSSTIGRATHCVLTDGRSYTLCSERHDGRVCEVNRGHTVRCLLLREGWTHPGYPLDPL